MGDLKHRQTGARVSDTGTFFWYFGLIDLSQRLDGSHEPESASRSESRCNRNENKRDWRLFRALLQKS
jgi:hypothetical protein